LWGGAAVGTEDMSPFGGKKRVVSQPLTPVRAQPNPMWGRLREDGNPLQRTKGQRGGKEGSGRQDYCELPIDPVKKNAIRGTKRKVWLKPISIKYK